MGHMVSEQEKNTAGVAVMYSANSATGYSGSVWLQCSVSIGEYVYGATGSCAVGLHFSAPISHLCPFEMHTTCPSAPVSAEMR